MARLRITCPDKGGELCRPRMNEDAFKAFIPVRADVIGIERVDDDLVIVLELPSVPDDCIEVTA